MDTARYRFTIQMRGSLFTPTFDAPDLVVDEDAGMYRFHNFMQHISPGSDSEILQTFTFQVPLTLDSRPYTPNPNPSTLNPEA